MRILPLPGHFQTGNFAPGSFPHRNGNSPTPGSSLDRGLSGSWSFPERDENSPSLRSIDRGSILQTLGYLQLPQKQLFWFLPPPKKKALCVLSQEFVSLFVLCYGNCCFVFFLSPQLLSSRVLGLLWSPLLPPDVRDEEERGKILESAPKELGTERVGSTSL